MSTALALLSDRRLGELLDTATPLGSGIGGTTWCLEVEATPVFVKRIPLADLELWPDHYRSTVNVFGMPVWAHYGVGSVGFGAWRELAAHVMTSDWAMAGQCEHFLLLHHWRVLATGAPRPLTAQRRAELERNVAFWHDDPGVRRRLEGIAGSSVDLVLFLEFVPHTVRNWLDGRAAAGPDEADAACALVERQLLALTRFMGIRGMQHFDTHFGNLLTDGARLYLTDFGLACSSRFELSGLEQRFLAEHAWHDGCFAVTRLVAWVVTTLGQPGRVWPHSRARSDFVRRCAEGEPVPGLPPGAAEIVRRYGPVAAVVEDFYATLYHDDRTTPYPRDEIDRACARAGYQPLED